VLGRGVCGSHQLKDDRCGGGEGGTVVGWLLCTADRRRTTVSCIQWSEVLIWNMQMLEILGRRRELGDGDWDWQAGRGWECHRLGDAEVCDCGWQRQ
jgi:hypothetical protein